MRQISSKPIEYAIFQTTWGHFGLAAADNALLRTHLPATNRRKLKHNLLAGLDTTKYNPSLLKPLQKQIIAYFQGTTIEFDDNIPVTLAGFTPFTQAVLNTCREITFSQTISYSGLAKRAGNARASRAVGTALGRNPLPLIIPCHRVIKSNSQLGGFSASGGTKMKQKMLTLEKHAFSSFLT